MTRDRLKEFEAKRDEYERESMRKKKGKKGKKDEEEDDMTLPGFLEKVKGIERKLEVMKSEVKELNRMQGNLYCAPSVKDEEIQKMENLADQILSSSIHIRKDIELLSTCGSDPKSQKKALILSNAEQRVQSMQTERLSNELKMTMNDFRASQASYLEKTKARLSKQKQLSATPDINTNNVHNLDLNFQNQSVHYGGMDMEYFQQAQKAKSELQDLQEREKELSELEGQIHEVNMLFKEMHGLVQEQGETITTIENYVEQAHGDVESGKKNLDEAKKSQSAARKKKIICISILVIVLIIAAVIIGVLVANSSGE